MTQPTSDFEFSAPDPDEETLVPFLSIERADPITGEPIDTVTALRTDDKSLMAVLVDPACEEEWPDMIVLPVAVWATLVREFVKD